MFEKPINITNTGAEKVFVSEGQQIDRLDLSISEIIEALEKTGLGMKQWSSQYENLPEELDAFREFYERLQDFQQERADALNEFQFEDDMTDQEKEAVRQFDREVMGAFGDHDNFLGNGATAEVYAMDNNDTICVKFITDQSQYNGNNHLRTEFDFLSQVYEATKNSPVRAPYPIFSRIHAKDGHSYGMEKIKGASLSQILEMPEKFPELAALAQELIQDEVTQALQAFVAEMHEIGVVHCDLYKRNIMLGDDGRFFVIDYGKAKKIDFPGEREDERRSDIYNARQSLQDFFTQLGGLTN